MLRSAMAMMMVLVLAACGDGNEDRDAGDRMDAATAEDAGTAERDAGTSRDAGTDRDAGRADDGAVRDDAGADAGAPGDAGTDASTSSDAGRACEGMTFGSCDASGVSCMCCPAGGPLERCLCTTACASDAECTDPSRPRCNRPEVGPGGGGSGICTPIDFVCAWGAICASPDTPIATPKGDRAIAELVAGDLVYSLHEGVLVSAPIARVTRTLVVDHAVVHVALANGSTLEISAGHPTADGRTFGDLTPGAALDGVPILEVRTVPYAHRFTHDILPATDSGTYVAGGVLIGSTLAQ